MTESDVEARGGETPNDPGGWAPYLDSDEQLLWEGAPNTGVRYKPSDIFLSAFGAVFGGFALFWIYMASSMGGGAGVMGYVFPLFGLPFLAVGAYFMVGRFYVEAYIRSKTCYALTDKRGIIARDAFGRSLKSYPIRPDTEVEFQPGIESTIYFAKEEKRGSKGGRYTVRRGFEYIMGGDEVYRLIRSIQQEARQGARK